MLFSSCRCLVDYHGKDYHIKNELGHKVQLVTSTQYINWDFVWQLSPLSLSRHPKASPSRIMMRCKSLLLVGRGDGFLALSVLHYQCGFFGWRETLSFQTVSAHASWQGFLVKSEKCVKSVIFPHPDKELPPCTRTTAFPPHALCAWPACTDLFSFQVLEKPACWMSRNC